MTMEATTLAPAGGQKQTLLLLRPLLLLLAGWQNQILLQLLLPLLLLLLLLLLRSAVHGMTGEAGARLMNALNLRLKYSYIVYYRMKKKYYRIVYKI